MSEYRFISKRPLGMRPFFSICVPQYNRTDFFLKACDTFANQIFHDFEVCISDDCSTDGKQSKLIDYLETSGFAYIYAKTDKNLRYDGNLRNAIAMSNGRYLLLMGNDDGLTDVAVLETVRDALMRCDPIAVAITNYRELSTGRVYRRVATTGILGEGGDLAAAMFRNYSFVSGLVFRGELARALATDAYDGSEMYQMYLGTRLVAEGGRLFGLDRVCVDKDLQIPGQMVDSYRLKPRLHPCPIVERPLPMGRLFEVVAGGLGAGNAEGRAAANLLYVAQQLYRFTYPFWLIEYRRIQSFRYAFGVYLGLRPPRITKGVVLSRAARLRVWILYLIAGLVGLTVPIWLFDALRSRLYALAKAVRTT